MILMCLYDASIIYLLRYHSIPSFLPAINNIEKKSRYQKNTLQIIKRTTDNRLNYRFQKRELKKKKKKKERKEIEERDWKKDIHK